MNSCKGISSSPLAVHTENLHPPPWPPSSYLTLEDQSTPGGNKCHRVSAKPVSAPPWKEPLSSCLFCPFFAVLHSGRTGGGALCGGGDWSSPLLPNLLVDNCQQPRGVRRKALSKSFQLRRIQRVLLIFSWFPLPATQDAAPKN